MNIRFAETKARETHPDTRTGIFEVLDNCF